MTGSYVKTEGTGVVFENRRAIGPSVGVQSQRWFLVSGQYVIRDGRGGCTVRDKGT